MAAYVIANYTVTNPEAYAPYPAAATETLQAHGVEIIAVDMNSEVLEGDAKGVTGILKFDSRDAVKQWYNSPEYQAVIGLRTDNSEGTMVVADSL